MQKIRKGDQVVVIAGKDKGRQSTVTEVLDNGKLLVQGVNVAKKHQKGNPTMGVPGGIVDKDMPINASNVMVWNPSANKGDRVGFSEHEGKKVRVFKSNGERVDA